jgi:pyruvate formate lyase activating enzyme
MGDREPAFMARGEGELVHCSLCPHRCEIPADETGVCGVRGNRGGEPALPYYAEVAQIEAIPMEQFPLYHFYPGTHVMSVSLIGATLQASRLARWSPEGARARNIISISADEAVDNAAESRAGCIGLSGGDAALHLEYLDAVAAPAKEHGFTVAARTAGFLEKPTARALSEAADAVVLELPFMNESRFEREQSVATAPFFETMRVLSAADTHTELLLRPDERSAAELDAARRLFSRVADVDAEIPCHIHPTDGDARASERLAEMARQYLDFVYLAGGTADTHCPVCERLLVNRHASPPRSPGLRRGRCKKCGRALPGRFPNA